MVYKVFFDLDSVDMNALFDAAYKYNVDMCFAEDCIYMHEHPHQMGAVSNIMKEINTDSYYAKKIPNRPTDTPDNITMVWVIEKMDADSLIIKEDAEQEELKKMLNNISKAKEVYMEMFEIAKNKQKNGGRGKNG